MAKDKSNLMPARLADQKEMSVMILEAVQSLGPRQRMAMLLSKYEGMSYNEIAEAMELTPQAVKSLLSRARSNLRDTLEPYMNAGQLPKALDADDEDPES
jgi:RNA polymerase sigma-70 factor (ECF subfamily)